MKRIAPLLLILFLSCNSKSHEQEFLPASIFLSHSDSLQIPKDIQYLESLPYVASAKFVSKDEAKKKYLEDGNDDWGDVLTENPLPDSYEVTIDRSKFSMNDVEPFKRLMESKIPNCTDVAMPMALVPR